MKKNIIILFMICLLVVPFSVFASSKKYESMNLEETLKDDNVEYDLSDYKETDDQVTIYLFRGNGCTYCHSFLEFISSITSEYGKYFKLESYEVFGNNNNKELFMETLELFDESSSGVPVIVINGEIFKGYSESYNESIKKAIVDAYNDGDEYDLFDELKKKEIKDWFGRNGAYLFSFVLVLVSTIGNIMYTQNVERRIYNELYKEKKQEVTHNENIKKEKTTKHK